MKETELKPCPFCGGDAEVREAYVYLDAAVLIRCSNCFVKTEKVLVNHPKLKYDGLDESTRYTKEQAIQKAAEVWNRRSDNEQRKAD